MLDQVMSSLAETLAVSAFSADENGAYQIEIDHQNVQIRHRAPWILLECELPLSFEQTLSYQQEQALKRCMQLALKTVRDSRDTLTVDEQQNLVLQSKIAAAQCDSETIQSRLSQHVSLCERYSELLEHERVNHAVNHTVWLP